MTDKIIALVDGSVYSESVCDHAAWISARTEAPVELVHVLDRREAGQSQDLSGSIRLGARSRLLEELAELDAQRAKLFAQRGRELLEEAQKHLAEAGVAQITSRLRREDLASTIADIEADARVIVIGKRGEAADFAKGHLGSNLERLVRAATRPVFVAARAFQPIEKVLLAFDGGASAQKAVAHVAKSPVFQGLEVHLVTVGAQNAQTVQGLEQASAILTAAGILTQSRIVEGNPDSALSALVDAEGFGMLVMGAYGHSRIRSLIIGSTTTEMIRSCKVPVLLMR